MYRFCKEKAHVDDGIAVSVVSKQNYQRSNITLSLARSRVSQNTWNLQTVNFASYAKQRESNKEIQASKRTEYC